MKLMQVIAGAKYGGAENYFVRLAIGIARLGIEQRIILRHNSERFEILRKGGIEPVGLQFGGIFDLRTGLSLKQQIAKFKPDIVLTWMNRATSKFPKGEFIHIGRLGGYYNLKYYEGCDHLIGNTEGIVEYLVKNGWPEDKAHYLPNFVTSMESKPLSKKELFTPPRAPLILTMGRLHENKAFDILLQAMTRVPDAYLWIAGDGPLREKLEKLSTKLGIMPRTRFLGWRDDISALLNTCDIFICPSRHEPLGNVVIEAWAHSKPVIAADSFGPGVLIEHLKSGVLVPKDDDALLAKAIRNVLADDLLRERITGNGHDIFLEKFTEEKVVGQYVDFFQKILRR